MGGLARPDGLPAGIGVDAHLGDLRPDAGGQTAPVFLFHWG